MKMWISRYALSDGIKEVEAEQPAIGDRYAKINGQFTIYEIGKDIHDTLEAAKEEAEKMRRRKIASLKKQLGNLEDMRFI